VLDAFGRTSALAEIGNNVCDPTGAFSVERRPGGDKKKGLVPITFAAYARSFGLSAAAASRCTGRREHGAVS
jgi:hypothetical protein